MKFVPLGGIQSYLSYGFLLSPPTLRQNSEVKFCCWGQRSWGPLSSDWHTHIRCCMLVAGGVLVTDPLGMNSLPLSCSKDNQHSSILTDNIFSIVLPSHKWELSERMKASLLTHTPLEYNLSIRWLARRQEEKHWYSASLRKTALLLEAAGRGNPHSLIYQSCHASETGREKVVVLVQIPKTCCSYQASVDFLKYNFSICCVPF